MRGASARELRQLIKAVAASRPWVAYNKENRKKSFLMPDGNYYMLDVEYVKLVPTCGKALYKTVKRNYKNYHKAA